MNTKIQQRLKDTLIQELQNQRLDVGKIQEITSRLSNLDEDTVGFSVDAGIIDRLGRELVAKQETAVSELVKNAYDADATKVDLAFVDTNKPGGKLWVRDNGTGMNREELINGFMRLSSTDKIHHPISPRFKRQRAGRKGIGRFAAQRLGNRLIIRTRKEGAEKVLRVTIDWQQFQNDRDLIGIRNRIEEVAPMKDERKGTILIIQGLREPWTKAAITRVYRYILDLIQPFPLSDERKALENKQDPGFKANFYQVLNGKPLVIDEDSFIFRYALAVIEGRVDESGQGYWSLKSEKLDFEENDVKIGKERDEADRKFECLRNINLKAHYFIYDSGLIPPHQMSRIRKLGDEKGGIRLYRNGFRVLPYAEPFDDWLKLDYSARRRIILVPHSNNNFFGFVEITDVNADTFEETSSREGLLENDAFKELTDFVHRVLIAGVLKVSEIRGTKATTSQKRKSVKKPEVKIREVSEKLDRIVEQYTEEISQTEPAEEKEQKESQQKALREISQELGETVEDIEEIRAELEEIPMLRVLASLGLVIGQFTHEIKHHMNSLDTSITVVQQHVQDSHEAHRVVTQFARNFRSLRNYTAYYDATVAHSINRELKPLELRDIINEFSKTVETGLLHLGIALLPPQISGFNLFTKPMHLSEWSSILLNLYTNSVKAIRRANRKGRILIRAGKTDRVVYVEFADNGDGIPEASKDRVFEPFFTTSSPAGPFSSDYDDISGTGLGLKIVKDIITGYDGSIHLITPPEQFSTCFRIEIPKATKEEMKSYEY